MKKMIKVAAVVLLVLMVVAIPMYQVYALAPGDINTNATTNTTEIVSIGEKIVSLIRVIGTIISVGVLIILGIKYMMGSPENQADYKKSMIPYLVGAVILFAATWIATAIYNFASGI